MLFFFDGGFRLGDNRFLSWKCLNLDWLSKFLSDAACCGEKVTQADTTWNLDRKHFQNIDQLSLSKD